jgi:membrane protein DedA with SNARE-associated domain
VLTITHSNGLLAVFALMVPESACLPVPSELTLMAAGFGVHEGWFGLPMAVAAATAGNLTGSLIAYWLGRRGLLSTLRGPGAGAVARCERIFGRRGESAVFLARLLPLARTFVSLPAGHAGVPLARFTALTVAGCAIWSTAFVLAGALAGTGWSDLAAGEGRLTLALAAAALAGLGGRALVRRR